MKTIIFLLLILGFSQASIAGWRTVTVDSGGDVGLNPSIALDSSGRPHISYYDSTNSSLKYAKWNGSAWEIETIDSVGQVGEYNALALDASGNPHISYCDRTASGILKYAKWNGSAWGIETVDATGNVGYNTSIAIDAGGNPHISYIDSSNQDLKYAKWNGSAWVIQTLDLFATTGNTSIAIDASGHPHITYQYIEGNVKYVEWNGATWDSIQIVDPAGGVGAMVLDPSGKPNISYVGYGTGYLKYAKWTGVAWSTQTVISSGTYSSIALDSSGYPHISYNQSLGKDLMYASWTGASWAIQTIDSTGDINWGTSLKMDATDSPHIAYLDLTNWNLKYADINKAPLLEWSGESNYTIDGVNPESGTRITPFVFRVKYSDPDNDAPLSGYPKVYIKKGGVNISGSPFSMALISSVTYVAGAIYSYSGVLPSTGTDYTYYFEANDAFSEPATGTPLTPVAGLTVTNNIPTLSWTSEANYVSDGLNPESGSRITSFVFRTKYTDADNDAPLSGYPRVHIKKGGVGISGSPFVMNSASGSYNTGAIYTYSKVMASTGTDYSYYFEAKDSQSDSATGDPTSETDSPDVVNVAPVLAWTGEANYTADGVNPETAHPPTASIFRVKYTDTENDAPLSGYPKVHIKKGGIEIADSPFAMSYVSGVYSTGAKYTFSKALPVGADYTYYFEAYDAYSALATGTPLNPIDSPDIINSAPVLAWTGETGYVSDGVNPNTGVASTNFLFKVKFIDTDGDAPASGYPNLHVKQGGSEIAGSPFAMNYVSGAYTSGAIYSYTATLPIASGYTYYFEANDAYDAAATGTPVNPVSGPIVSLNAPVLSWTGEVDFMSDGLDPEYSDRNMNFEFRVKYSEADNEAPMAGYPKVHIKQDGQEISGSPFAMIYVSGANSTGAIYRYSMTLTPSLNYTYYYEAPDINGSEATGSATFETDAPDVDNQLPVLTWTGEANYFADGVSPRSGTTTGTYIFRVKYSDSDNDLPAAGYPRVRITQGGVEISGSPFILAYDYGPHNVGAIYELSKTFTTGDYSYLFEAKDLYSGIASGDPTREKTGPVVIGESAAPPAQAVKVFHGIFKPGENERSQISFNTTVAAQITIKVYNTAGQMIRELFRGTSNPGLNSISWDGKDSGGARVSSGVYVIRVEGGGINQSKRVIVVR